MSGDALPARRRDSRAAALWQRVWTFGNRLSLRLKLTLGYALIFSLSVMLGALCVFLLARGSLTRDRKSVV